MKSVILRLSALLCMLLVPVLCFSQGVQLIAPVKNTTSMTKSAREQFESIVKSPNMILKGLARLNRNALDSEWIAFQLPGEENQQVYEISRVQLGPGDFKYEGLVARKEGTRFALYTTRTSFYGVVSMLGRQFTIDQIDGDLLVVMELDRTKSPPNPEGPSGLPKQRPEEMRPANPAMDRTSEKDSRPLSADRPVIDILFVYSDAALSANNRIEAQSYANIESLNTGMTASGINATARRVGFQRIDFQERGNITVDLDAIINE